MGEKYQYRLSFFIALFLLFFLSECKNKVQLQQWNKAFIDSLLSKNDAYEQLNLEKEVHSFDIKGGSPKKTSGVSYFTNAQINLSDSTFARLNNCKAFFFNSDTLRINIGISSGFTSHGFTVRYKNGSFITQPYYYTDVIGLDESDPIFDITYQSLKLDKFQYSVGDSIYGWIDFKLYEIKNNQRLEHHGNGYFRAIVTRL